MDILMNFITDDKIDKSTINDACGFYGAAVKPAPDGGTMTKVVGRCDDESVPQFIIGAAILALADKILEAGEDCNCAICLKSIPFAKEARALADRFCCSLSEN